MSRIIESLGKVVAPHPGAVMQGLMAVLVFSFGMLVSAKSENYPIYNGAWGVIRLESNGLIRRFASADSCNSGPWMTFEGDERLWIGINALARHTLRSITRRGENDYVLDEGSNPFDARSLQIVDVDQIKLTLVDGATIWLLHCYSGR